MAGKSRYTLPREIEIARIIPGPEEAEGERIELRLEGASYVATVITHRGGEQHAGRGDDLQAAFDDLSKTLPAAAQRTSREGSTIAVSRLRRLQDGLRKTGARVTLQRSTSLRGAWKAEASWLPDRQNREFGNTVCAALVALTDAM